MYIAMLPFILGGTTGGDLPVYANWASKALFDGVWPVFGYDWVYPVGAIVPVVLPMIFGPGAYQFVWLVLMTAANGAALWFLIERGKTKKSFGAAWWWLFTVLIMCPVAMLRIEGFTAPAVLIALLLLSTRPRAAAILLVSATWVKVWPVAVVLAAVVASTKRWVIIIAGVAISVAVSVVVALGGGIHHLASFVNAQNGRPLQVEAPLSTPWLWMSVLRVPGAEIFHDTLLKTEEVRGPGDSWIVAHGTQVMLLVMAALVVVLALATRRLSLLPYAAERETDLVLLGAISLAAAFIVFNKVGSPQYMQWITPIVAVGLVTRRNEWRFPGLVLAIICALTTLDFPILYTTLLGLNPVAAVVLGLRNVMLVVVLVWSVVKLGQAAFVSRPVQLGTKPVGATEAATTSY